VILRLDPAVPVVWRAPDAVQLGVDPVVCVFEGASEPTERLLAALAVGTPASALPVIAETAGAGERFAEALLDAVRPALLPEAPAPERTEAHRLRIAVEGDGPAARMLAPVLHALGIALVDSHPGLGADPDDGPIDAAVLLGAYAIAPRRHGAWLRADIPHLGVVFGERSARIGPFVEPGEGPCLACLDLERRDADEAWPVIAAQLAGKRAPAEAGGFAASVTLRIALELVAHLTAGSRELTAQSLVLRTDGGESRVTHSPHARCGCRALPGSATADVLRLDRFRPRTSSDADAAARG